jgi:hypothetical protein
VIILPLVIQSGIAILSAALIFPETVNAQFVKRLRRAAEPLIEAIRMQPRLLEASATTFDYNPEEYNAKIGTAEAGLFPITATARLLKRDLSWGRFGCEDLRILQHKTRILVVGAPFDVLNETGSEYVLEDSE